MFSLKFNKVEDEQPVAWENIKKLSKLHNLQLTICAVTGWFNENPGKTNTDLEKKLREEDLDIYLIASPDIPPELDCKMQNDMTKTGKYMLIYSCRPKEQALKEVLTYAGSYEENFSRLNEAGILMAKGSDINSKKDKPTKPYEEQDIYQKLQYNTALIEVEMITEEQYEDKLKFDLDNAKTKTEKEPEMKLIGMAKDGSGVYAYYIGNQLVSNIGIMMGFNKNQQMEKKCVSIQDKSEWTGFMNK